jgi:protein SCO1/2
VVAVFFGYTHCPDVCPLTLARLGRYQAGRRSDLPPLEVVFVSVDPGRDTPDRLAEFVTGLPGTVVAVTANEGAVREQAQGWGVMVLERDDPALPPGDYLVDHTARTFILDPNGMVVATLPPMSSEEEIAEVMEAVFHSLR